MSASEINGPGSPADWRDVKAVRKEVERMGVIGDLREQNAGLFRAEMRATMARVEKDQCKMLKHLERLVVVPASEGLPGGVVYEPSPLVRLLSRTLGARPSTTRLMLAATVSACIASTLTACAFGAPHWHP